MCPRLHARAGESGDDRPIGTWENGSPKYYCIFHKKEVGHSAKECNVVKGKTEQKFHSYAAPSSVTPAYIREQIADALPQYADLLLMANITKGVIIKFQRPTTKNDVDSLRTAMPGMGLIYSNGNNLIVEARSEEERTTIEKRMQGAEDHGKPLMLQRYDKLPAAAPGPIKFGAPPATPIQFAPAAPSTGTAVEDDANNGVQPMEISTRVATPQPP